MSVSVVWTVSNGYGCCQNRNSVQSLISFVQYPGFKHNFRYLIQSFSVRMGK